jgi:hypothetical protein
MTQNWHIRPYRDGDEKQILKLRRAVFGDLDPVRLKESTWQWQFQENPSGRAVCFLAESAGKIVGQYVTIPTRFSIHGKEILTAFSCDTMIHPEYRRQGMFSALARKNYDFLASDRNIHLVWGFPNDKSQPGFVGKLDWRMMPIIPLMVMPLKPIAMVYRSFPVLNKLMPPPQIQQKPDPDFDFSAHAPGLIMDPVSSFGSTFDTLWQNNRSMAPVVQVRDSAYLQWRYLSVPEFAYRPFAIRRHGTLVGYVVMRMMVLNGRRFGVLVDLFPFPMKPDSALQTVFSFAKHYAKHHGGDFLTCILPRKRMGILKSAGFRMVPEIINPKTWRLGYLKTGDGPWGNLDDWHVTYGDTDVV